MREMGKLDSIPGNPGLYAFLCDCGYDRRKVTDSERFFACERPVEAKVPPCKLTHEFASLHAAMEKRVKEAAAKKFLAENDAKVAAAKAVLATPEVQSHVETKVLKRGPGRPKKESK
jgi:hypothetical protein